MMRRAALLLVLAVPLLARAADPADWHEAGHRGGSVKVAILDTGFRDWRAYLGGPLPKTIATKSFRRDGDLEAKDSPHGILCGEVVHALAPDAELLFATWEPDDSDSFLAAVRWARRQGAKLLTCSVIVPAWSDGEGGGAVHAELAKLLGDGRRADDALFFACAGNVAQRHWSGPFAPDRPGSWHQWRPGVRDNVLTPWGTDRVSVEVLWKPGSRYAVQVLNAGGVEVAPAVVSCAADRCGAMVRFDPKPGESYRVRLRLEAGEPRPFHLVSLGAWLGCYTARGSIPFPGDGPEVVAVGAVDAEGKRAAYSSCGPNSSRPKPDLVATVPFPTASRERPFAGTSAAAPQAAALAALVWSKHPDWSAQRVRDALLGACRDLNVTGHDYETGNGLLALPPLR